jgi:phosphohistidine swiveling domain-containing protein
MTDDELADALTLMVELVLRLYRVHMAVVWPAMVAMLEFQRTYDQVAHERAGVNALDLVGPLYVTETIAASEALWASARGFDSPGVFARGDPRSLERASFIAGGPGNDDGLLAAYRLSAVTASPVETFRRAGAMRESLVRGVVTAFPDDASEFLGALRLAREGATVYETHGKLLHEEPARQLGRLLGEAGRRLAGRRRIASPEDVEFLTAEELNRHIRGRDGTRVTAAAVSERRAEFVEWSDWHPPWTRDGGREARDQDWGDCPFIGLLRLLYTRRAPTADSGGDRTTLRGTGAAAGRVAGRACVLRQAADAALLRSGDVIISREGEAWLGLLISVAGGLVAEGAGPLLHVSVTARALGRPAVVEVADASTSIADGDTVEVDGVSGIVHVLRRGG